MSDRVEDVTIPGEPRPTDAGAIRTLTIIASALTAASIIVNVILQIAHFLRKRPIGPDQRDRLDTAALSLSVFRQVPGIVRQIRLLASQLRQA
jgi:hypothetical protein